MKSKSSLILTSSEQMFLIGGEEKGVYLGTNFEFSLASQTFTEKALMPEPRVEFGCIYYGGCVYVVGGWKNFYIQRSDRYSIQEDTWYDMPSLKEEREGVSLCIVEDKYLFAIGNITTRGKRIKIPKKGNVELIFERLNLQDKQHPAEWEQISVKTTINQMDKLPSMKHMGCFNHYCDRNKILIFGGGGGGSPLLSTSFVVDLQSKSLKAVKGTLMKADRFPNHIFFKKDDFLFVFGEFYLHMFDLKKDSWSEDLYPLN
jgi:hypothetical protein